MAVDAGTALDALVDYVFEAEPSPGELEDRRRALPSILAMLASLFLNIRLMLRWQGFGVSHSSVQIVQGPSAEAVILEVRVYNEAELRPLVERGLARAGFMQIGYRNERLDGMGGWVTATAPPQLLTRLRN